jgi:threonine synthase
MTSHFHVKCLDCGLEAPYAPLATNCPRCNGEWREARYDYDSLRDTLIPKLQHRPFRLWRYHELLPIYTPYPEISLGEGGTPLIKATNLGTMLGCSNLYIKDERQGPTASFKDRQAAVTIAALKEAGITEAVIASTGNVAIAYSAYAARAGIKLWAFLTSLVPAEKMREVAIYGTQVVKVTSSYDQAKQVAAEFARQRGLYLDRGTRSISSVEGMKTIAFEIAERLGERLSSSSADGNGSVDKSIGTNVPITTPWRAPDWYIQAVSGGLGPIGVQKGFAELYQMGLIDKIPAIAAIQAEGCSPMVQAWRNKEKIAQPVNSPRTHIATLSTGDPGRTYTLLQERMIQGGGGFFESVSDEETFRTMHVLAKMEGLSVEPAAAVAFAGLIKLLRAGKINPRDIIVVNCTGHTMAIEPLILGKGWARNVVLSTLAAHETPEEGLLAALSRVTEDRYHKVLIIDDTPEARRLILRIMQSQGNYTLMEASNGREGLDLANRQRPDLIILDLMMPEMDGFAVLDQLKANPDTASIPVIVVTAKELTAQEKDRLSGQIESLMQKGNFMDNELLSEIRTIVK